MIDLQENGFSLVMKAEARLQGEGRMRHLAPYVSVMVKNGKIWSSSNLSLKKIWSSSFRRKKIDS